MSASGASVDASGEEFRFGGRNVSRKGVVSREDSRRNRQQSQGAASSSRNADVPSGDAGETWRNVTQTAAAALFPVSRGLFNAARLAFAGSSGSSDHGEQRAGETRWSGKLVE